MSYSWRLSRGGGQAQADARQQQSSNVNQTLRSAAVETPLTPPSVRNVSPSICLSMIQFRALMQEYRALDDTVTTRLNRTLANSRATGLTTSPSLLSGHIQSSTSKDLGKSTYANAPEQACLQFWRELVDVWIGREEVLQYCLKVEERNRLQQQQPSSGPIRSTGSNSDAWFLDNDVERERRLNGLPAATQSRPQVKSKYDAFDSRVSRSENSEETLRRQMKNELAVEAIIRKRSLEVFKSRCKYFTPTFSPGSRGEQERAMWEGKDTRAGQEARM